MVLLALATGSVLEPETDATYVQQRLQGTWRPLSAEYDGKELDPEEDWKIVFEGDEVRQLRNGKVHVEGRVDFAGSAGFAHRAFWRYENVKVVDSVIYRLVGGDRLVTCWTGGRGRVPDWPEAFASGVSGGGRYFVIWRRES